MRTRTDRTRPPRTALAASAALAAAALLTLTACEGTGTPGPTGSTQADSRPSPTDSSPTGATTAVLPNLIGQRLDSARKAAREAGFPQVGSDDALGRGRGQILERNWRVCFQTPVPGTLPRGTKVGVSTVKTGEKCPAKDPREPNPDGKMPDFTGKSVRFARTVVDQSAEVTARDVSGKDRTILVESHWKVCGQEPAPGVRLGNEPVRLDTVKFDEKCP
ncbi:PASTA domain-containing protein [Streptomyces paludis]|uniref:PASTA domain-containing protein n=1 Tax=Streptomyces paludis TaxID=2282738 RepID=A0A345HII3_9ACTN|nr:PASTA domain-containing protein [Streptomyces paludis]AXG76507.1 hypothetical protein DVK44_01150 [Streptomyces paludis]